MLCEQGYKDHYDYSSQDLRAGVRRLGRGGG